MDWGKWKNLISYYRPYKKELFLDLLFSVICSLAVTIIPFFVRYLTNTVVNFEKKQALNILILISLCILGLFVIVALCQRYTKYQGNMVAAKVESDIKIDIFSHLQEQDFSFFDENKIGKLMSYITTDAYNLTTFLKKVPEILLDFIIRVIGAGIVLFMASPFLGSITFGILSVITLIAAIFIPKMQREINASRQVYAELTSDLEESLSGIKTTKSFTNEEIELGKFRDDIRIYLETNKRINKISGTLEASLDPILIGLVPITTIISMFFFFCGNFNMGDLVVFMLYADILISPIFGMFNLIYGFNEGMVGFKRISKVLSVKPDIEDRPNSIKLKQVLGNIRFKDVSFVYKSGRKVFDKLNLDIAAGEFVALVGPSGVGKSTLCNLIPRFYDVTEGEIFIDGEPIKNIKLKSLRKNIGFVSQDIFLFSGSVKENIRYGNLSATDEEIVKAAKKAHAHEFIINLEKGYDTYIGQRGVTLSGGQKQRIAIARAFLKNPPILIFDEATSSLDNESERLIQQSMVELAQSRTTIVIAHRLSTIKNAKRILVLNNGGISQQGTHGELISEKGVYADLYNIQFKNL